MQYTKNIKSAEEMIHFGEKIGLLLQANDLITLEGDLGAGKTTLTKGIAKGLGVLSIVNSPTFTIMKIHQGRLTLYHLDVYRLQEAAGDFELEEYFEQDGVCVIEWASHIETILPAGRLAIKIEIQDDESRKLELEATDSHYQKLVERVLA